MGKEFCMVDRYDDGTISYWVVVLPEEARNRIDEILMEYSHCGYSCRGNAQDVLTELVEVFNPV